MDGTSHLDEGVCIRIWTRYTIPRQLARFASLMDDEDVESTVFVAHVPAAMLADRAYRMCNGDSEIDGWMPDGDLGFFGCNALDTAPHPDGDGIILIGSWR